MNFVLARVLCVLGGYCFGLFETGAIIAKKNNVDLRKEGSGNIGTTNSLRVMGVKAGAITLLGDVLKCIIAMLLAMFIFRGMFPSPDNGYRLLMIYAGIGAILGHDYPFYHHFKGGKGVACVGGMIIAFSPVMALVALAFFVLIVYLTRYVSLGSMLAEILAAVLVAVFGHYNVFIKLQGDYLKEAVVLFSLIALLCIFQHRANIGRLVKGEENKFSFKSAGKKKEEDAAN